MIVSSMKYPIGNISEIFDFEEMFKMKFNIFIAIVTQKLGHNGKYCYITLYEMIQRSIPP